MIAIPCVRKCLAAAMLAACAVAGFVPEIARAQGPALSVPPRQLPGSLAAPPQSLQSSPGSPLSTEGDDAWIGVGGQATLAALSKAVSAAPPMKRRVMATHGAFPPPGSAGSSFVGDSGAAPPPTIAPFHPAATVALRAVPRAAVNTPALAPPTSGLSLNAASPANPYGVRQVVNLEPSAGALPAESLPNVGNPLRASANVPAMLPLDVRNPLRGLDRP